jgi:hypothetical protein
MNELGIVVFGHRRPQLLGNVLESLRRQGALQRTHVWVDGVAHAGEIAPKVEAVRALAQRYSTAGWVNCHGRLGIEKMMLDALTDMARRYRDIVVLEDDCFPTADALQVFAEQLELVRDDPTIYSVYGNPFGTESSSPLFPRFQGWGWATTRDRPAQRDCCAGPPVQLGQRYYPANRIAGSSTSPNASARRIQLRLGRRQRALSRQCRSISRPTLQYGRR